MNVDELIGMLEEIRDAQGGDTEVRFASQPSWPMEYNIDNVAVVDVGKEVEMTTDSYNDTYPKEDYNPFSKMDNPICYIIEDYQIGYLPGEARIRINEICDGRWDR